MKTSIKQRIVNQDTARFLALTFIFLLSAGLFQVLAQLPKARSLRLPRIPKTKPRNIIFLLTDDHRYDALGFLKGQPFIETPNLDAMARNGVYLKNAFVTTALCSPSRASILTGLYAHQHRVVDNNNPVPDDLVFFPQYLQQAGYETAMIGKWHMGGEKDDPQRGFNHWVSFKGQGTYLPNPNGFNVDGKKVPQKGYITDELTDYAINWLNGRKGDKPFMLYLSHKGVHADFVPAARHKDRYKDKTFVEPRTQNPANVKDAPMWVRNQRNSWHGVDFPYHSDLNIAEYYKQYAETLLAVDESVGRVMAWLKEKGLLDSTLVIYMGDNGFAFGEHGLIDKRTAYEESMRVPMLMQCPELFKAGTVVEQVVANIDIAPTALEAAGLLVPKYMAGKSFIAPAQGKATPWRDSLLYEYYWERNFPQTPTVHALRGSRYKYIHFHGIWDADELYDLQADPLETTNLIFSEAHQETVKQMNRQLFDTLKATDGMYITLYPDRGGPNRLRRKSGSGVADFPPQFIRDKDIANPQHK
ncbi:MAG TPA: sulfatase [Blastocatellia bacterium]|nr:sulfatase [Blastocatellia bacterium]HMV85165.1 sulfatase [Blastocatellia bacterium]HMX25925.1 sulfatase [Blastocatellia bacterium]HMY71483.1 sulfatase [Blastocatellia bacterium]HMZ20272.1 sulfatase [Blastocatellia bacterium]